MEYGKCKGKCLSTSNFCSAFQGIGQTTPGVCVSVPVEKNQKGLCSDVENIQSRGHLIPFLLKTVDWYYACKLMSCPWVIQAMKFFALTICNMAVLSPWLAITLDLKPHWTHMDMINHAIISQERQPTNERELALDVVKIWEEIPQRDISHLKLSSVLQILIEWWTHKKLS